MPVVISPSSFPFSFDGQDSNGTVDKKMIVEFCRIAVENYSSGAIAGMVKYDRGACCLVASSAGKRILTEVDRLESCWRCHRSNCRVRDASSRGSEG